MNKATVVKVDGTEQELDHQPRLEEAVQIVGSCAVELVRAQSQDGRVVTLIVDGVGKLENKPVNKAVTEKYGQSIYRGYIVGDVLVLEGWQTVG